jgi:hypothetical protein
VENTLDWTRLTLAAKLNFACGTPRVLEAVKPILKNGSGSGTA